MIRLDSPAVLWSCAFGAVFLWGWVRLGQADGRIAAATTQFTALSRDLQRLADLRDRIRIPTQGRQRQDDLVSTAQKALTSAGMPIAAFSGVQPRADQTGNGMHIQTVQMRLQGLRPVDFGAWLRTWNAVDQAWRLSELQMVHATTRSPGATPLDTNRYDFTLLLTAPYLEDRP